MSPQDLLTEWNATLAAREEMMQQVNMGQASKIAVLENDIAKLQWFMRKLLVSNVMLSKTVTAQLSTVPKIYDVLGQRKEI